MIPDLKRAFTLYLADNAVRCRDTVMRGLKNMWDLLRDWDREDEQI
jgi:hypothetical protein